MSRYSSPQNQEMLWNIINQNVIITQYFTHKSLEHKHNWFKTIIRMFYERNIGQQLTPSMLTAINKETIVYMIQDIRSHVQVQTTNQLQTTNQMQTINPVQYTNINTPTIIPDNTQIDQINGFNMRVKDYEQMNMKPTPDDINFSDKQDEHIDIDNMNNMLKIHMQQRENDMQMYKPQEITSQNTNNMSIKIMDTISIDSTDIIIDKKTVSWDINNDVNNDDINVEIKEMKDNIIDLFKELELIKNLLIIQQKQYNTENNIE